MAHSLPWHVEQRRAHVTERESTQGRVARGTGQLFVGQLCFFLVGYPTAILLARGFGPEDYGTYGVILSVLLWVEQFSRFGIPPATAKLVAEDHQRASLIERAAFVASLLIFSAIFCIFWLAAPVLARIFNLPGGESLFRLAGIDIPIYGLFYYYHGVGQGRREFGTLSAALVIYVSAKLLGVLCLFWLGLSIPGALIVNIFGSMAGVLFFATRLSMTLWPWQYDPIPTVFRLAVPLAIGSLAEGLLHQLDIWSLKAFMSEGESAAVGIYVAASQLAKPLPQVGMLAVSFVLLPAISRALALQDMTLAQRYIQGAVRFLLVLLLPMTVLIWMEADHIMVLLYSTAYGSGGAILGLLILGASLFAFLISFLTILKAKGNVYFSAGITYALIVIMLGLNRLLIPRYGSLGAASALTITVGVGALCVGWLVYRHFGPLIVPAVLFKVVLATALMATISSWLPLTGGWLVLKSVGLMGGYAFSLWLLGELKRQDLQLFALWR